MNDAYQNFQELFQSEKEGKNFRTRKFSRDSSILVMAPHGGYIEKATTLVAEHIAGDDFSFYSFEALEFERKNILHITSTNYDEPIALTMAHAADVVLAIHGCKEVEEGIILGGLHQELKHLISEELRSVGFIVDPPNARAFPGMDELNICNRGRSGRGVQIEIMRGLRDKLVEDSVCLDNFVRTIRATLFRISER